LYRLIKKRREGRELETGHVRRVRLKGGANVSFSGGSKGKVVYKKSGIHKKNPPSLKKEGTGKAQGGEGGVVSQRRNVASYLKCRKEGGVGP